MTKKASVISGYAVALAAVIMAFVMAAFYAPITGSADIGDDECFSFGGAEPLVCIEETEYIDSIRGVYSEQIYYAGSDTASYGDSREFFDKCAGQKWGYIELGSRSNGAKRQKMYNKLMNAMIKVWNNSSDITSAKLKDDGYNYELSRVTFSDIGLSKDEAKETFFAFILDNPVFYFMSKTYSIVDLKYDSGKTGCALKIYTYKDFLDGKRRKACQDAIKKYLADSQSLCRDGDYVYNNILRLHDKVIRDITYSKVSGPVLHSDYYHCSHNILGGIMYGKGVCESYSKIFQLICCYCGYDSVYVVGKVNKTENHVWNLLRLDDGNYYCVDVTWDDNNNSKTNYAKGTMSFNTSHTAQSPGIDTDKQFFYTLPSNISARDFEPSRMKKHTHEMGAWTVYSSADCIYDGVERRVCKTCGHYELRTVKAAGHKYTERKVEPTCAAKGYTEHKCTVCGYVYKDSYVDALSHKFTERVVAPTCTEEGYTEHKCSVCGLVTKDNTVKAKGHFFVDTIKKPTCTQYGCTEHKCTVCGTVIRDSETKPVGHRFKETSSTPATCTQDGKKVFVCEGCKTSYEKIIKAEGHKYVSKTVAPTATSDGYTEHRCSVCGHTYRDAVIPAGAGEYILTSTTEPTCVKDGEMILTSLSTGDISKKILKAKGHVFEEKVHAPTCTEKGYTEYICKICGERYTDSEIPANGHHYVDRVVPATSTESGYTEHKCTECGHTWRDGDTPVLTSTSVGKIKVAAENTEIKGIEAVISNLNGTKVTNCVCDGTGKMTSDKALADGSYKITVSVKGLAPRTESFTVKGGASSLGEIVLCRRGDINGDGKIDDADVALLQQIISGWNIKPVYMEAADLNGNKEYDNEELALLQQYVSGWNVDLDNA